MNLLGTQDNLCLVWMTVLESGVEIISLLLSYNMPLF